MLANVAAAEELEKRGQPCMYRVHDQPDKARVDALREVLEGLGLKLPKGQVPKPQTFTRILDQVKGTEAAPMVSELILRAQAQAAYSPRTSAISVWLWPATPISPRRSGAMPTSWCIAA